MADDSPKNSNLFLYLALAGGAAYMLLGKKAAAATDPNSWLNTTASNDPSGTTPASTTPTPTTSAPTGTAPTTAPTSAPTTAPTSAPATPTYTAPAVSTPAARPGYPMDGEPNIVFASSAVRSIISDNGQFLTNEYGDGSRNVRVALCRAAGETAHIYVEDLRLLLDFWFHRQSFGSWDEMYYSFINNTDNFVSALAAYNQANPLRPIYQRW